MKLAVYYRSESLSSLAPKTWEFAPDWIREEKRFQFPKIKLKSGQLISVHANFAKIIQAELDLFKAVPITFIAVISSFINSWSQKIFWKQTHCMLFWFSYFLSNCVLLLLFIVYFYVIWSQSVLFIYVKMN